MMKGNVVSLIHIVIMIFAYSHVDYAQAYVNTNAESNIVWTQFHWHQSAG